MFLILQVLWAVLLLLFFAGCLAYMFNKHLGLMLWKRSAVLLGVILIGPSLVTTAFSEIPTIVLVLLGSVASVAAYFYVTNHATHNKPQHSRISHAERQPRVPHQQRQEAEDEE